VLVAAPGVVINEIVPAAMLDWNDSAGGNGVPFDAIPGTGVIDATDQWIEILNTGTNQMLIGWTLELIAAGGATTVVPIATTPFFSGQLLVIPSPVNLATIVTLRLKDSTGFVWDDVDLAAVTAALGPATGAADEGIARVPNGLDTGLITNFKRKPATIGAFNPFF